MQFAPTSLDNHEVTNTILYDDAAADDDTKLEWSSSYFQAQYKLPVLVGPSHETKNLCMAKCIRKVVHVEVHGGSLCLLD